MAMNGVNFNASEELLLKLKKGNTEKTEKFSADNFNSKPIEENTLNQQENISEQKELSNHDNTSIFAVDNPLKPVALNSIAGAAASSSVKPETSDESIKTTMAQFVGSKDDLKTEMKKYLPDISQEEIGKFVDDFFPKEEQEKQE